MVGNSVILATGGQVELAKKWDKGAAIRFISGESGTIKQITVPKEVYGFPGIEEIVLYNKAGDTSNGTKSSNDRLGHVIATGKDAKEAFERATDVMEKISVIYEEK